MAGNQAFSFIGDPAFSGTAGELRLFFDAGLNRWFVEGDVNGDGVADLSVGMETDGGFVPNDANFIF